MKNISEWVRSMGFPPLVERAEMEDQNRFGGIKPVMVDGSPRRIRPEMIVSMLSLMSVGDPRAPKNMKLTQRLNPEASDHARANADKPEPGARARGSNSRWAAGWQNS